MSRIYIIFYVLLLGNISFAEVFHLQPGEDAQQRIQEAMILAKPGDTIQLDEGVYRYIEKFNRTSGISKDGLYCYNFCTNTNRLFYANKDQLSAINRGIYP